MDSSSIVHCHGYGANPCDRGAFDSVPRAAERIAPAGDRAAPCGGAGKLALKTPNSGRACGCRPTSFPRTSECSPIARHIGHRVISRNLLFDQLVRCEPFILQPHQITLNILNLTRPDRVEYATIRHVFIDVVIGILPMSQVAHANDLSTGISGTCFLFQPSSFFFIRSFWSQTRDEAPCQLKIPQLNHRSEPH